MDETSLHEAITALTLRLAPVDTLPESQSLEDLRRFLVAQISTLLDKNPAHLMSILYRVDVDEARVQQVLQQSPIEDIPRHLADLLIERQMQKIQFRRMYGKK